MRTGSGNLIPRIDELHFDYPFAGSRMLRDLMMAEGFQVGRRHVGTLMKRMRIEAVYRKPNTSKPAPGHRIYPYLLRNLPVIRFPYRGFGQSDLLKSAYEIG
jgi:putative transposase